MSSNDVTYYQRRAAQERALAQTASSEAKSIHAALARAYAALVNSFTDHDKAAT